MMFWPALLTVALLLMDLRIRAIVTGYFVSI